MLEYKEAIRIKPDYAEAHFNLGDALSKIPGRSPDAIAEYQAAIRIRPDYAGVASERIEDAGCIPTALRKMRSKAEPSTSSSELKVLRHASVWSLLAHLPTPSLDCFCSTPPHSPSPCVAIADAIVEHPFGAKVREGESEGLKRKYRMKFVHPKLWPPRR